MITLKTMIKYYNAMVVFEEIPDEITLAINITNCPCKCKGCHSKFLWDDVGEILDSHEIDKLIENNDGITCVCFMGGDKNPRDVNKLARYIVDKYNLKCGWYSGRDELSEDIDLCNFAYVKIGHYDEELGGLDKETTNQRMYRVEEDQYGEHYMMRDITYRFWKKRE